MYTTVEVDLRVGGLHAWDFRDNGKEGGNYYSRFRGLGFKGITPEMENQMEKRSDVLQPGSYEVSTPT